MAPVAFLAVWLAPVEILALTPWLVVVWLAIWAVLALPLAAAWLAWLAPVQCRVLAACRALVVWLAPAVFTELAAWLAARLAV